MVPWVPILIGIGIISAIFVIKQLTSRYIRSRKKAQKATALRASAKKREKLVQERALFPPQWLVAYDKCLTIKTSIQAKQWLKKWISEQSDLPCLSTNAVHEFAIALGRGTTQDKCLTIREEGYLTIFVPYLDTKPQSATADTGSAPSVDCDGGHEKMKFFSCPVCSATCGKTNWNRQSGEYCLICRTVVSNWIPLEQKAG